MLLVGGLGVELLERDKTRSALQELVDGVVAGQGGLAVVEGPAGIGKTSVLELCSRDTMAHGLRPLSVRGDELVMESSFAAVRELLWREVQSAPELFDGAARLARPVFEDAGGGDVDRGRAGAVTHGLYWLTAALADRGPLAFLIDDAQWLDAASARFVTYLARRIESLPLLVVLALRTGENAAANVWAAMLADAARVVLRLGPLSPESSTLLVRDVLGPRADEALCSSCHRATGGNPFYLHELTAALSAESGPLTVTAAERVRALGVVTIGRYVLVRLSRLGHDCERLAQAVAVLGPGSSLRHGAALAGLERDWAEAAADRLRAAQLLAAGGRLAFVHPIVGEVIAAELADSRRAALHREAARVLLGEGAASDRVAAHLLSAEPYAEAWVVEALRLAAKEALARGAPEAAVAYLRRALAEPPDADARLDVLTELGRAETYLPNARDFPALREAFELARDPQARAEIALELAAALLIVGQFKLASALLDDVLQQGGDIDPATRNLLEGHWIAGASAYLPVARRVLDRSVAYFYRARQGEIADPVMLAALAMTGSVAGRPARDVVTLALRALGDERIWRAWPAAGGASIALTWSDELGEAARFQDRAIGEGQSRGSAPIFLQSSVFRSCTAFRAGDLDVAEDHGQRGLEVAGEGVTYAFALQWYVWTLLERGRAQEAAGMLEGALLGEDELNTWLGAILLAGRGAVAVALGQLETGLADLLDAERRMTRAGLWLSVVVDWVRPAVAALLQLGRRTEAVDLTSRELEAAAISGASRRHGVARSLRGSLADDQQGLTWLQEGVEILAASPARLEYARALVNLGTGLTERGQRQAAREPLSTGLEIAHGLGAAAVADQARAALIAAGARPRRAARRGPGALTPAELRTARMAAQGLTNREIAQALFVSARTVEAQLHQAYAKLAIGSRKELGPALVPVSK